MADSPGGIGETLRRAREERRLSLADAERLTKIRGVHLAALEEERFGALPPRPFAKGFVRTYAQLLGLEPEGLVAELESRLPREPAPLLSRAAEVPLEPAAPPWRWRRLVASALWVVLIGALWAGYVGYTQLREFTRSGREVVPAVSPGPAADRTPTPAAPTLPPATPPGPPSAVGADLAASAAVTVQATITGTSWIRVVADGERVFQGILNAGAARTWTGQREVIIRVGNAAAVELVVNGRPLGRLGGPGRVVELRFPEGPVEP